MRGRDLRAIVFWILSTAGLVAACGLLVRNWIATVALLAGYEVWLLTRPRMVRVFRRMRGKSIERSSYFRD